MKKILLALSWAGASTIAFAQMPPSPPPPPPINHIQPSSNNNWQSQHQEMMRQHEQKMWNEADANHDGKIDRAEFLAQASKQFDMIDQDHKGYLVPDDFKALGQKMREKKAMDMRRDSRGQDMPNGDYHQ